MKAIYYVIGVVLAAIGIFVYLLMGDTQENVSKIKLSYFNDEKEVAETFIKLIAEENKATNAFWVGVEPGKLEQLDVALQLKTELEKKHAFVTVIVDQELGLSKEWYEKFKTIESISIKENIKELAQLLGELEKINSHTSC